ncbi:hypothetical protein [Paradevosia shaoguanensis]|uniref:hypothetical protein n=1 Tax=Paradevosia shaoguanensis TaxID=1335043 RepID=UPI0019338427|nr:hypothetical protein [Paradevosia shaoguanensis]
MSCGYEGYEFGGGYIDSCCIDGFLWDLDSCDEPGGGLTHGGDFACPRCNTGAFLEQAIEDAESCGVSMRTPWCGAEQWERAVAKARKENQEGAEAFLASLKPFIAADWPDRQAVHEGRASWENTISRQWPWEQEAQEQIEQKLTRSRKEPMIFLPSEIERAAFMARSALNPERAEK